MGQVFPPPPSCANLQYSIVSTFHSFIYCSTSAARQHIINRTRLRVVDNTLLGREAELAGKRVRCIQVYKHSKPGRLPVGTIGDKILVSIMGQKKKAYIVGVKQKQRAMVPKMDSNNIVLIEDNGTPTGTRIRVPIPSMLRGKSGDVTKILSIATKFV